MKIITRLLRGANSDYLYFITMIVRVVGSLLRSLLKVRLTC